MVGTRSGCNWLLAGKGQSRAMTHQPCLQGASAHACTQLRKGVHLCRLRAMRQVWLQSVNPRGQLGTLQPRCLQLCLIGSVGLDQLPHFLTQLVQLCLAQLLDTPGRLPVRGPPAIQLGSAKVVMPPGWLPLMKQAHRLTSRSSSAVLRRPLASTGQAVTQVRGARATRLSPSSKRLSAEGSAAPADKTYFAESGEQGHQLDDHGRPACFCVLQAGLRARRRCLSSVVVVILSGGHVVGPCISKITASDRDLTPA